MSMLQEYTKQEIYEGTDSYRNIQQLLKDISYHKILVVCGGAFKNSILPEYFEEIRLNYCIYDGFQPNPTYENILEGLSVFQENNCDLLISVGGGSAIDVAKCIKAYAKMDTEKAYVDQEIMDNGIYHLALPTTAGTGSESTQFAVMYYKGNKMSVNNPCLLPNGVILEPSLLATLPDYQKKATILDALCQATESYWSMKSNEESRRYAKEAISIILRYGKSYINANKNLIEIYHASNLAGRAINNTQTTLAHAMSYKLTSLYGISHGHAVALCLPFTWEYLCNNVDRLQTGRTKEDMEQLLSELREIYRCETTKEAISLFRGMFLEYDLKVPSYCEDDLDILANSVNAERMNNYPACIEKEELKSMYVKILSDKEEHKVSYQLQYNVSCDMQELEGRSELKRAKILGLELIDSDKERQLEAAGKLLETILAYANNPSNRKEIREILSEMIISLNGYPIDNEVDTINYLNACERLKKYAVQVNEEEKQSAANLASTHEITQEHALVLWRFITIAKRMKKGDQDIISALGVEDASANIYILRGMLFQLGLLVKGDKKYRTINRPSKYTNAHRYVFYWKNIQARFYNEKYNSYLEKLRIVQLEMMDEIARVCDANNLTYVLNYGSLLGAIRHKGFIPWDDDLDICMPREDYEKFLEIGRKELGKGCYIYNNQDFHDCWFSMMKVMKKDTVFLRHPYRFGEEDGQRIFIDVWPLDNVMGSEEVAVAKMKKKKSILTRILRLKIKARCGGQLSFTQKWRNLILLPISEKCLIQMREKQMTQWRDKDTDYWISGGVYDYIKETMPKAWYVPTTKLSYEGHEYKFPGKWDEVLKHFYGNYMQVPPIEKRYTHAPFKVCMEEGGEVLYFNETMHRGRRSFRSKIKRKLRKGFRILKESIDPALEYMNSAYVLLTAIWRKRGVVLNNSTRKLKSYSKRYEGQTCYLVTNSNNLSNEELEAVKNGISFVGDNCYNILNDKNWQPDFYCISQDEKEDKIPKTVLKMDKTEIFYTKRGARNRRRALRGKICVPYRMNGKMPQKQGEILQGYYDTGADNVVFMLELAIYMGFSRIVLVGTENGYDTYHMKHFLETEKFAEADISYEKCVLTENRIGEIKSNLDSDKTNVIYYHRDKIN